MGMKKIASSILMSAIALGQPIVSHAQTDAKATTQSAKSNTDMKQGAEATKKRKDSLPDMIGGIQMVNIGGYGIPPHIYGQNHVRRGCHKRSNCK